MPKSGKAALIKFVSELWWFGIRQAQASLFAGALLVGILASKFFWPTDAIVPRYDFLFCYAIAVQMLFIILKFESWEEVRVIFVFHVVGTAMELFKTHVGSWMYPEPNFIRFGGVPLFSGFMYSAVGSYIARVWRVFDFRFECLPRTHWMVLLCVLIYANFFTHHYVYDIRYGLFALSALLFYRTKVFFKPNKTHYWMPLLLGFVLVALFIWVAENVGTLGAIWIYPNQLYGWHVVSIAKMGSWFLLMLISFVLVSLLHTNKQVKHS
jgi:uncharacterized membrane protein YoaT (DUF817 family)